MKVIYQKTSEAIRKAILAAYLADRRIAHIELSPAEANELSDEMRGSFYMSNH